MGDFLVGKTKVLRVLILIPALKLAAHFGFQPSPPIIGDEVEDRSGGLGVGIKKATRVTTPPPEEPPRPVGMIFSTHTTWRGFL